MKCPQTNYLDHFMQKFNYTCKVKPYGASLSEFISYNCYYETSPNVFSLSVVGPKSVSYNEQFSQFLVFAHQNNGVRWIGECLYVLFCNIIIKYRSNHEENALSTFIKENLSNIPNEYHEKLQLFINNPEIYRKEAMLFTTQKFILKISEKDAKLLVEFVNEPRNSQLKCFLGKIITVEVQFEENSFVITYPVINSMKYLHNLSIIHCNIRSSNFAAISNDSHAIFSVQQEHCVTKLDTQSSKLQNLNLHSSTVTSLKLSGTSKVLLSSDISGNCFLWSELASQSINICETPIWCSSFPQTGGIFALGCHDSIIRIFDTRAPHRPLRVCVGHNGPIVSLDFHPNCSLFGSCARDEAVRIWDIRTGDPVRCFFSKSHSSKEILFSHDGKYCIYYDEKIKIVDIGNGNTINTIDTDYVPDKMISSIDDKSLIVSDSKGSISYYDFENISRPTDVLNFSKRIISIDLLPTNELRVITSHTIENILLD